MGAKAPGTGTEPSVIAGRYRLAGTLGQGASGVVYVAEDTGSERRVALKLIHRHLVRDHQISRRFDREARILSRLSSPNLAKVLDFGQDDGRLYMALELVEGRGLEEIMQHGPLAVERCADLMLQICAALECAHSAGIVHRDLKPSNVIVETIDDDQERVRVLDFGMAKVLRGEGGDSLTALTEQNMVFGTPEYMAPEQARGDDVDARCDVYAAGVILYELLTGSVPFDAETPIGTMTLHLVEAPLPPSSRAPGRPISRALEGVVLHALAKDRRERYPSASAFAQALRQAIAHPSDVGSIAPPGLDDPADLETRDTEHAIQIPGSRRSDRERRANEARARRVWIVVAVIAALVGILLGIVASLSKES